MGGRLGGSFAHNDNIECMVAKVKQEVEQNEETLKVKIP